jgi:hypothetical protein
MPRIEVTGDICLMRPSPTQGSGADEENEIRFIGCTEGLDLVGVRKD